MLPVDARQRDHLYERLLSAEPNEVPVIRDALVPHQHELIESLWIVAEEPIQAKESQRLRAACALAIYDPDSSRWERVKGPVAADLARVPAVHLATWMESLRPVRLKLLAPLAAIFRDAKRRETERLATDILADYAADQPELLADLLLDADEKQFAVLYPGIEVFGEGVLSLFQHELGKEPAPDAKEEEREKLAKRQANAGVALLRMGQPEKVWPLLKHSSDPRARSYLIHRFSPMGAQPKDIIKRLEHERDVSIRQALLLILGEFSDKDLPVSERETLLPELFALYRNDTDPGLHAAAAWLLRQWGQKKELQKIDQEWANDKDQREKSLEHIRREWANNPAIAKPRWIVNSQGQTFVVLPGPVQFQMGSPLSEAHRSREEVPHQQHIGHTIAIATTHVTLEQFKRCPVFRQFSHSEMDRCPDPDCPVLGVSWYMAALYCIWLSHKEGLPQDQWCYLPNKNGGFADGMQLAPDYLQRTGYRLLTEAEWEYACRAGAVTSRYYGQSEELLERYAWYAKNSAQRTWPVGSLKPNDFGLFDMQGQVQVWCQDQYTEYGPSLGEENKTIALAILGVSSAALMGSPGGHCPFLAAPALLAGRTNTIEDAEDRVLRGGSFIAPAANVRSACRRGYVPKIRNMDVGFRLARTVRP